MPRTLKIFQSRTITLACFAPLHALQQGPSPAFH